MAQQEKIYYLTKEQYNTLWNNGAKDGSFEHGGTTYTYEENATYYVKEENGEYLPSAGGTINGNLTITGTTNSTGLITQGSPSSDSTITSMNRLEAGLFVSGSGSAPNNPKAAGFYMGKSQTDENRHIDIVSGADFSYIDFNQASNVKDFQARCLVNVSTGGIDWQWDSGATNKIFNVNGIIAQNGTAVSLEGHTHSGYATTDTKNTAGSTNISLSLSDRLYFVGAKAQSASNQTYSSSDVYLGLDANMNKRFFCNCGISVNQILAPISSGNSNYGKGSSGQTLMTNGSTVYWGTPSSSGLDTSKTLTLSNGTPIELTGFGTGTYNKGVFVCNQTDKFGVECPRETDNSNAAIVPFRVGVRGGGLGNFETGDASVSNLTVNNKLYGPQMGSNPRNQYDSGLYFFNCDPNSTSSYNFGLYQWVDKFQFTTRTASNNEYKTTAFEIDGNTGTTSFSVTPTVNGTLVSLNGHTHSQYLTKTNVTQSQIAAKTQVVIANSGCYIFIPTGATGGSLYHGTPDTSHATLVSGFTGPVIMHSGTPGTVHYFVSGAYKILQQTLIFFTVPGRLITIT